MALLCLAALLGLLGEGPLSKSLSEGNGIKVHFDRFLRNHAEASLDIILPRVDSQSLSLRINNEYLSDMEMKSILPLPHMLAGKDETDFVFNLIPNQDNYHIQFFMETREIGLLKARVRLNNGPTLEFQQIVYP